MAKQTEEISVGYANSESNVSGTTTNSYADALDLDTRGAKSISAVVKNADGANSLDYRLRARPANYSTGSDEEIPECPGEATLGPGEEGLVSLIRGYSRVKIQVKSTVADSHASYSIDYLTNG